MTPARALRSGDHVHATDKGTGALGLLTGSLRAERGTHTPRQLCTLGIKGHHLGKSFGGNSLGVTEVRDSHGLG